MIRAILLAAALMAPVAAQAQDWRLLSVSDDKDAVVFIDAGSITSGNPHPSATIFLMMNGLPGDASGVAAQMEYDCSTERWHGLNATSYDGSGKVVQDVGSDPRWNEIASNGLYRPAFDIVCKGAKLAAESHGSAPPIAHGRSLIGSPASPK
ncbi:surface-adhesin E family protein [Sphingomonas sp. G-3-2-10]|uniref:surface-adhesin E family protein n=1 Tax=Sphingomonas sp. G-3-2-10 TaxID=2728838 RepID=UPI00146D2210|nr:surface-adhesin E family protein [Sphingomonas sp. G-3-2-10]NML05288.1 hypothetical protein [Sphingomonas sp. G-3-2-10]